MTDVDLDKMVSGLLAAARDKFILREYDDAIGALKKAEVHDPENPEVLYNLGVNYARKGLFKSAAEYFSRILKLPASFIDNQQVKKLSAYSLIHLEKYTEAEDILKDLLTYSSNNTEALNMLGYCLNARGEFRQAEEIYRRIIELDPENINACNSLAYLLAGQGIHLDEALEFSLKAHSGNNESGAYLDTLGYVYLKKGLPEQAAVYLERAREKLPYSREITSHIRELKRLRKKGG